MKEQKAKKQNIKNSGITLIALVVTIVVLLILAAVSISMLGGENGIITQAKEARDKTKQTEAEERVNVEVAGSFDKNGNISIPLLNENLKNNVEGITHEGQSLDDNPITSLPATVEVDGYEVTINGEGSTGGITAGTRYDEDTDLTIGDDKITIPGGATISGIPGEYEDIDEGIVIYIIPEDETPDWTADDDGNGILDVQEDYDQFVWVPVKNAVLDLSGNSTVLVSDASIKAAVQSEIDAGRYPMAIKKDATNYFGVLYGFEDATDTEGNNYVKVTPYSFWKPTSTNISSREPAYLTDSSLADGSSYNNTNPKVSESLLQSEFNTMVTRVASKGGFWVGRYETSSMVNSNTQDATNRVTVIRGTGIASVDWYRMYAQQKAYKSLALTESASVTSSMIWGSQWDQIMIWMKSVPSQYTDSTYTGKFYVTNAVSMGNYGIRVVDDGWSSVTTAPTGNSDNYKVKNVFDLAGNVLEWTLEAGYTSNRVARGGNSNYTNSSGTEAGSRDGLYPYGGGSSIGSRATLY